VTIGVAVCVVGSVPEVYGASTSRGGTAFDRVVTYPVYQNRPTGQDPLTPTAAEISAVTADGGTLVYTDSPAKRIGFLDISDPRQPRGLGTLPMTLPGDPNGEPTSVTVAGRHALVTVNTSAAFTEPTGRLDVIDLETRERVRSLALDGQPDSIALSGDRRFAAIAIENERDETVQPTPESVVGDLPQAPGGFLQIVDLPSGDPGTWTIRKVPFTAADGSALPSFVRAGLAAPSDPEPEYVSVNQDNQIAVTLQENNGIVLVDAPTGEITKVIGAGTSSLTGVDTLADFTIDQSGSIIEKPREPDAVGWIDDRYLAIADEGDLRGGTRGWSVVDSCTGRVVWDAGNSLERLAVRFGLHNEERAGQKGVEIEGVSIAEYGGVRLGFVASERSNFVAVYDLSHPAAPVFRQLLATTGGPEGLLPIPSRNLFVVSSESDKAALGVRSSITVFRMGGHVPSFPTLVSGDDDGGAPIGWGSLSALSAVPGTPGRLATVTDGRYTPTRILSLDTTHRLATVTGELVVRNAAGEPATYDAEGLFARPQGGFWLVSEGRPEIPAVEATETTAAVPAIPGRENQLIRVDDAGVVREVIPLPGSVAQGLTDQGLHGVTAVTGPGGTEQVWVALRRAPAGDPAGTTRLGRYDPATRTWAWFGYPLDAETTGLTEVTAVDTGTLAVIERDDLGGPDASIKRVYTVRIPTGVPAEGLPVLPKTLAVDVLPVLTALHGWVPKSLEGLAVGADGNVYVVTDNGGMVNATGETVFLRLGLADELFGGTT
jgi:hypothetical protein